MVNPVESTCDSTTSPNGSVKDSCDLLGEATHFKGHFCDIAGKTKRSVSSHLVTEIEALHAALKQRDLLISSLQCQLLAVCQSRSSWEAERAARQRERQLLLGRSAHLQKQIDSRRAHVKTARLALDQIDSVDRNIDECIRRAELEYHLETEELNILNLQGEHMRLKSRLEARGCATSSCAAVSLSSCLPSHAEVSLHLVTVPFDAESPCFTLTSLDIETGAHVEHAEEHCGLRKGDRLLEVNGERVLASSGAGVQRLLAESGSPLRLLVVRCQPPSLSGRRGTARQAAALRQELALLAGRLEQKTGENKRLHAEQQRCQRESRAYRAENELLVHRLCHLEQRVRHMQGVLDKIKGVTNQSLRCSQDSALCGPGQDDAVHEFQDDTFRQFQDYTVAQFQDETARVHKDDTVRQSRTGTARQSEDETVRQSQESTLSIRGPHTATISVNVASGPGVSSTDGQSGRHSDADVSWTATPPDRHREPDVISTVTPPGQHREVEVSSTATPPGRHGDAGVSSATAQHQEASDVRQVPLPLVRQSRPRLGQMGPRALLRMLQGGAATLEKPRPPRKPARLSLQRATSLQTLQTANTSSEPSGASPPTAVVKTWPSMDGNLQLVRQRARAVRVRHQVTSLPRPSRPAVPRRLHLACAV